MLEAMSDTERAIVDERSTQDSRRKPVLPKGYEVMSLANGNKWVLQHGFVQFPFRLDRIPSEIKIGSAEFDGTASIIVDEITNWGFKYSVGYIGKGGTWGSSHVAFDWEAVE